MINFSLNTLLTSIFIATFSLFFIIFLCKKTSFFYKVGINSLFLIVILFSLRLYLPIEFSFSRNIYLPQNLSKSICYLRHPMFLHSSISIWNIVEMVWFVGIIINFISYVYKRQLFIKFLDENASNQTIKFNRIVSLVQKYNNYFKEITILELDSLNSPILIPGKTIRIVLPNIDSLNETDYINIFSHELYHFKMKDLYIKYFFRILCIIYWWNPILVYFEKNLDVFLEIRVDEYIMNNTALNHESYIDTIMKVAKNSIVTTSSTTGIPFCDKTSSLFSFRMQNLLASKQISKGVISNLVILISVIVFFLSYSFLPENSFVPTDISENYETNTSDNTLIIDNEDGTYDVYMYNKYIETTDSLEYYPANITIERTHNEKGTN